MSDTFKTFPNDKLEALAMLYTQNQDLSDITPEQLFDIFEDVYNAIRKRSNEYYKERREEKAQARIMSSPI